MYNGRVVIEYAPLEDELGDVLEKAMRHSGLTEQVLAERSLVAAEKIRDAIDYRYDLTIEEIRRLAVSDGDILPLEEPLPERAAAAPAAKPEPVAEAPEEEEPAAERAAAPEARPSEG